MLYCPIATAADRFPNFPAFITDERSWSYKELDALVRSYPLEKEPFVAKNDLNTILRLFALLRNNQPAFLLSHRLPPSQIEKAAKTKLKGAVIALFTSGSSGKPKIAGLTLENFIHSALGFNEVLKLGPTDRWHLSLPLFHVGGIAILFRCFLAGAAVTLSPSEATHVSFVPAQLRRLLKEKNCLPSYKGILIGGAPITSDLIEKAQNIHLLNAYGMTEMSSTITLNGDLLPHRELSLSSEGEILVKGKTLFQGYFNGSSFDLPLDAEGYFHTKDLGKWIDGKLHIIGRKDNLFISGGENIQPEEIENALLAIPDILEAVVVPVPSEEFGARPAAFIRARISLEQLRSELSESLPKFKIPDYFFAMPENAFKPSRKHLAETADSFIKAKKL